MKAYKQFGVLLWPICVLILVAFLLYFERAGIVYSITTSGVPYLSDEFITAAKKNVHEKAECALICDSTHETYSEYYKHMSDVLNQMSVGFDTYDLSKKEFPDYSKYVTVVVSTPDLDPFGDKVFDLVNWVYAGGRCMFQATPDTSFVFRSIADKLGIVDGGITYATVHGLMCNSDFMIGGDGFEYPWEEPAASVINVRLYSDCTVHVVSNDKNKIPMVWERDYGKGRFVVNNHGMCEKITRGLSAASYACLEDFFAYPVINSSIYFIDDCPSPVPLGDGSYIRRDYNRDIGSFYKNIWLEDMVKLHERFGIVYTGLTIETYGLDTTAPFATVSDTNFKYFGGKLLDNGGEVGLHGYNHLPLCLDGFDFEGKVDYKTWGTKEDMRESIIELCNFTNELFPDANASVYVPPSNILSKEGREVLGTIPQIKTISSLYLVETFEYEQEFCVADDGIVELPRIISGTQMDTYIKWSAFNELNMHYVNSHFMHPDDTLDVDRGAANGWAHMINELSTYIEWLTEHAPNLRNMTGSDAAKAVQRYDSLTVDRYIKGNQYTLQIKGFYDEAYFLIRLKDDYINVEGGTLEKLNSKIYVLHATEDTVVIHTLEEGDLT